MLRTCTPRLTLAVLGLVLGACRADLPPEYLAQYQKHADVACGCVSKIKPATEEKDGVVYNTKESCDAWRKEISACFGPGFGYRDPDITPPPGQDNYVDFEEKLSEPDQRKIAALKEAALGCVNRYFETCK